MHRGIVERQLEVARRHRKAEQARGDRHVVQFRLRRDRHLLHVEISSQRKMQTDMHFGIATDPGDRSEEHTSELQSLMRISYAVFCLKKTKKRQHKNNKLA